MIRLANDPDEIQLADSLFQALIGQQDLFGNEFLRDYGTYLGVNVNPGSIISPSEQQASVVTKSFAGTAVDPSTNQITVSLGRASGSGLTFNLFGTELTYGQPVLYEQGSNPAIGGLVNGQIYWVIVRRRSTTRTATRRSSRSASPRRSSSRRRWRPPRTGSRSR